MSWMRDLHHIGFALPRHASDVLGEVRLCCDGAAAPQQRKRKRGRGRRYVSGVHGPCLSTMLPQPSIRPFAKWADFNAGRLLDYTAHAPSRTACQSRCSAGPRSLWGRASNADHGF